jgi:hypothetical protein
MMCVRVKLQALLQGFKLVCNAVSWRQVGVVIISQTSVAGALLLSSFAGPVERRVKGGECEGGVDIRFSFPGVCVNEFSIM